MVAVYAEEAERIADAEYAAMEITKCRECCNCRVGKVEVRLHGIDIELDVGYCPLSDMMLSPKDLDTTIKNMGCF